MYRFQETKQIVEEDKYKGNHSYAGQSQTAEIHRSQNPPSAWEEQHNTCREQHHVLLTSRWKRGIQGRGGQQH